MTSNIRRSLAALALCALGLPHSLLAQASSAPEETAPASETVKLDTLVVTGEKLGRTAQETQLSVAGFGGAELAETTDRLLADVFDRTANIYATGDGFSIRGIPNTGFTFAEGSDMATVLVDGANYDSQMLGYSGLSIWDIDQIEIMRGPQSTSQGRNSMAGAVIATTKRPTFQWDGTARATYGEYNSSQLAVAAGGPLVPEVLAFRVSIDRHATDGAATNVTLNDEDWDTAETIVYRGKLLLEPAKWKGFSALATYAFIDTDDNQRVYAYGPTKDSLFDRLAYENTPGVFAADTDLASFEINQEFANRWLLTATSAWSSFNNESSYDGDRKPTEALVYGFGYDNETLSQEVRLLAQDDKWKFLTGLYAAKVTRGYHSSGPFYYVIPSPLDMVFGLPTPSFALLSIDAVNQTDLTNTALFLNGEWQPSKHWTLAGGVRFDREEIERDNEQNVLLLRGFPNAVALMDVSSLGIPAGAPADLVLQQLAAGASASGLGDDDFQTLLPSAGITYHWTPDMSAGFTVTRGYRSGGISFNQKRASAVAFAPEYTTSYELSFRSQWMDKNVTFNANAFYVDWKDQQVSVQLSSDIYDTQVENAGRSTYYGFEVELREKLTGGWSLYQNLGHTRSHFDEFVSTVKDYSGNQFPNSPEWTASAGLAYEHPRGWFGTANLSYVGDAFNSAENLEEFRLRDRLLLNAKFGYRTTRWFAYVYGTNLLDEQYFNSIWDEAPGLYSGSPGAPRVLGVGIETHF